MIVFQSTSMYSENIPYFYNYRKKQYLFIYNGNILHSHKE